MLTALKEQLRQETVTDLVMESTANADVRDIFLDSFDAVVLGAENDPEINALVSKIPEYDETDTELAREIEALTESAVLELN